VNKYLTGLYALLMWASGTGFILITLSGETLDKALLLSAITLVIMVIGLAIGAEE
jgi:hypothetical protein